MRPVLVIKIDPALSFPQNLSQRAIGAAFSYGELENANKPLGVAIIGDVQALLIERIKPFLKRTVRVCSAPVREANG